MNKEAAHYLSDITSEFYRSVHGSFSSTRQHPWTGWEQVAELAFCGGDGDERASDSERDENEPYQVLDLACGNLRFARFVASRIHHARVWAADNCDELVGPLVADDLPEVRYQHVDLVADPASVVAPACDLCVCFGFMHHVPLVEQREALMHVLVDHVRPGGHAALSFWQFERDERLRAKATPLDGRGDYLLGWQHEQDVRRYCHSFSEDEIDALVASVTQADPAVHEVARFSADGRSGDLNRYVVLARTCGQTSPSPLSAR